MVVQFSFTFGVVDLHNINSFSKICFGRRFAEDMSIFLRKIYQIKRPMITITI